VIFTPLPSSEVPVTLVFVQNADASLGEALFQRLADFGVLDGQDVRQHFDDGDLGAVGVEEVRELDADGTGADDDDALRLRGRWSWLPCCR